MASCGGRGAVWQVDSIRKVVRLEIRATIGMKIPRTMVKTTTPRKTIRTGSMEAARDASAASTSSS